MVSTTKIESGGELCEYQENGKKRWNEECLFPHPQSVPLSCWELWSPRPCCVAFKAALSLCSSYWQPLGPNLEARLRKSCHVSKAFLKVQKKHRSHTEFLEAGTDNRKTKSMWLFFPWGSRQSLSAVPEHPVPGKENLTDKAKERSLCWF